MKLRSRPHRLLAVAVVHCQLWVGVPMEASARPPAPERSAIDPGAENPQEAPAATSAPPAPVNRSAPRVQPPGLYPTLPSRPSNAEIAKARVFGEPLVPIGGTPTDEDNEAVGQVIQAFLGTQSQRRQDIVETFLRQRPNSPWRASLLANMGVLYRRNGFFTRAEKALKEAWDLAKASDDPKGRLVADAAVGDLLDLYRSFGRLAPLETLVDEVGDRPLIGSPAERLREARAGVWVLHNQHQLAIPSGPSALRRIRTFLDPNAPPHLAITAFHADEDGATLLEMSRLADEAGLALQMAFRNRDVTIPLPAMMHFKVGHFSALLKQEGDRFLIDDPCLGGEVWMTREALLEESSGYFLVPQGPLPQGWSPVDQATADIVRGKCAPANPSGETTAQGNTQECKECEANQGMATFSFHALLGSLHLQDTPVGYTPPRGPPVQALVTYNQRESYKPLTYTFSNLGTRWNLDWVAWIEDDPLNPSASAYVHVRGGGRQTATGFAGTSYAPDRDTQAVVTRVTSSPIRYERILPDGSKEVYAQPDGAATNPRRVFMTQTVDAQGNALTFSYDSQLRLVSVTDAIGQVTVLSYDMTADPLKVTMITDPFGRSARFEYNTDRRLVRIWDVIGIKSEFEYQSLDFIGALTTPYGTTTFRRTGGINGHADYGIEATDPLGGTQRLEWILTAPIPATDSVGTVPTGFLTENVSLANYNTFFWDKRAMALFPGDHTKAKITRWNNAVGGISDSISSTKMPLENRVWYAYPQAPFPHGVGPLNKPITVARVLDDGATQDYRYEYNAKGKVIRSTDPVGRETVYVYGTGSTPDADQANGTGIDLLQVKQKNRADYDVLSSATYNSQHLQLTSTDASNQTVTYTYNTAGQLLTVITPPRGGLTQAQRTTTYAYDTNGYSQSITGPLAGATTNFTHDGYGRRRTVTDSDSYTVTYDYDALDRQTRATYPDTTYDETVYNRLDPEKRRDRLGRLSETFYDALRRPVAMRDPLGRTTTQQWCNCGSLDKVIDPSGNAMTWERDLQGRVTREIRADGSAWEFTYENTISRLKQRKDPKNQLSNYSYFQDNNRQQVSYTNAVVATPTVSFTYDAAHNRLLSTTDGTGTTTLSYNPVNASLGSGALATVDGPLASDTILYTYDEMGRVASRGLSGFVSSLSFDALDRLSTQVSPVGHFTYSYDSVTSRPLTLSYPNGQATQYGYFPNSGDHRLQQIKHLAPGGATISKYDYTYDAVGNIATWSQQLGAGTAKLYTLGYDAADQLTSAKVTGPTPLPVPGRFGYAYEPAGNRTAEQLDDAVKGATYNARSQLLSRQPGGALLLRGTVNEPATVTVSGEQAQVATDSSFVGQAQVPSGTSNVVVAATDPSGNLRMNTYQLTQSGSTTSYTYDHNGNLSGDGTKTFEWDAENRLTAVKQGATALASFTYDGQGRRFQKTAGGVTSTYVYDGFGIIEERLNTGATMSYVSGPATDQHWAARDGASVVTYFLTDHLSSVVQATNAAGTVTLSRGYDPYGNLISGSSQSGYAFTGREWDSETGLYYYRARYYDPTLGRFISEDPIGLRGGLNVFEYARNSPARYVDALGFAPKDPPGCSGGSPCKGNEQATADALCRKIHADPKAPPCLKRGCPARVRCNTDPTTCTTRNPGNPRPVPVLGATHGPRDVHLCFGEGSCDTIIHELLHQCYETEDATEQATANFAARFCGGK